MADLFPVRRGGRVRRRSLRLPDYGLTVSGLAGALGVSRESVNELVRERRAVSPEIALRLGRLFGNPPEF
jgi:addiction module HigA family antidote